MPAGIGDGPKQGGDEGDRVQDNAAATAPGNQYGGDNHRQTHRHEIKRSADEGQSGAEKADCQADNEHQSGKKPQEVLLPVPRPVRFLHMSSLVIFL